MKTLVSALVLTLAATTSFSAMAEGSKVTKSTIINASKNKKVINAAIGNKSKASVGSITIEGNRQQVESLRRVYHHRRLQSREVNHHQCVQE